MEFYHIFIVIISYNQLLRADLNDERHYSQAYIDVVIRELIDSGYLVMDMNDTGEVLLKANEISVFFDKTKVHETSTVVLENTTNKNIQRHLNQDGTLIFDDLSFRFIGRFERAIFRSSLLESFEVNEDTLILKTMNST